MIRSILLDPSAGACAYGIAETGETSAGTMEAYQAWLDKDFNAGMEYMANHLPIRRDPELLLPGAKRVISLAFPYSPRGWRDKSLPAVASYAYGQDYHEVLRKRLNGAVERLKAIFGGDYRICIDSAPIFERLWAEKCGIGQRSDNGLVAVEGYGTRIFLAEILSTAPLPIEKAILPSSGYIERINTDSNANTNHHSNGVAPTVPSGSLPTEPTAITSCIHCGACLRACPAGALQSDSTVDARRCLSYLTIEHRGEWTPEGQRAMATPAGRVTLFGCDICQSVCPMNAPLNPAIPATEIGEFHPSEAILTLTAEQAKSMTQPEFSRLFKGSPIKRTKLAGFLRNADNLNP